MLRPTLLLLLGAVSFSRETARGVGPDATDTLRPGSATLRLQQIQPYTIDRQLQLTRGDTTRPFGRQGERLVFDSFAGQSALLHVITFDTPAALTVDSSWVDPVTLSPRRMVSRNRRRTIVLEFQQGTVRMATTPAGEPPTIKDIPLPTAAFEWNMLPVALAALELHEGDRFDLPLFSDRAGSVVWYAVTVSPDSLQRPSGFQAPMWRLTAKPRSEGPAAVWWVSRRHHFLDQARIAEPGVAILYARTGL